MTSSYVGAGKMMAELLVPMLQTLSTTAVSVVIFITGFALNFLLTPLAICAGFSEPIAQIAAGLGMNPQVALYSMFVAMDQVILPYEYLNYLIFYAFGFVCMKDFIKIMSVKSLFGFVAFLVLMLPWWHVIGLY